MFCKNCGNQLIADAKFCDGCGTSSETNSTQLLAVLSKLAANVRKKKGLSVAAIGLFLLIGFIIFSNLGGGLTGTWAARGHDTTTITFRRGGRVTVVSYQIIRADGWGAFRNDWSPLRRTSYCRQEFSGFCGSPDNNRVYRTISQGRYSISTNRIEFIAQNGSIDVFNFSRTANTLTIGNIQFNRR